MNYLSAEIRRLIDCLNSLHDGDRAVDLLVACGEAAIAPLRKYLMEGQPSHIYQPRQRAVIVLARLDAKEVLMEYLSTPKETSDPVFQFGEEAVENTAARALARWKTDEVFDALLRIAYTRTLPGVIEALGSFRRPETVPLFIAALMDDVSRFAAENALKSMDELAKPALIEAACTLDTSGYSESPSILLRRRSAMRILADETVTVEEWPRLKEFLHDDDPEISISAARMALDIADPEGKKTALKTLMGKIPFVNWYSQTEIESCLVKHYGFAYEQIVDQIAQRTMQPEKAQTWDRVLQMLLNVRRRAGGANEK
jgi:HEAT repeat protein